MSKQEAERLADALERDYEGTKAQPVINLLRQWPDEEPVAWRAQIRSIRYLAGEVQLSGDAVPQDLCSGLTVDVRVAGTAPPDQSARIAELEQEVSAWRATTNDAHDYHRAAMVELSNILGVKDPENEPRFKWVALQASKVVERISELERQRDALLEALRGLMDPATNEDVGLYRETRAKARAAIKAAGGGK